MYYNGLSHEQATKSVTNGIHSKSPSFNDAFLRAPGQPLTSRTDWCERGGIVGRGVLVDWVRWYEHKHGKAPPSPVTRHEIPVAEIDEALKYQGTTTRPGDILIVRTGYVRWHK